MISRKFEIALRNNKQSIVDALDSSNPFTRAQTLAYLIDYHAFDTLFIETASRLLKDEQIALFNEPVNLLAQRYLDQARQKESK